jgi:hypothetical protein
LLVFGKVEAVQFIPSGEVIIAGPTKAEAVAIKSAISGIQIIVLQALPVGIATGVHVMPSGEE